jgi:hypothetical protein
MIFRLQQDRDAGLERPRGFGRDGYSEKKTSKQRGRGTEGKASKQRVKEKREKIC